MWRGARTDGPPAPVIGKRQQLVSSRSPRSARGEGLAAPKTDAELPVWVAGQLDMVSLDRQIDK